MYFKKNWFYYLLFVLNFLVACGGNTGSTTSEVELQQLKPSVASLEKILKIDTSLKISDTNLIKMIVLDSLSSGNRIRQYSSDILLPTAATLEKLTLYQENIYDEIQQLHNKFQNKHLKFFPGLTSKSFTPISQLTGEKDLTTEQNAILASYLSSKPMPSFPFLKLRGIILKPDTISHMDIRAKGVRLDIPYDQGTDGTCWAFAASTAYEISYQIKKGVEITTSKQQIIDCSGAGTTIVGQAYKVFDWMVPDKNLDREVNYPYTAGTQNNICGDQNPQSDYFADYWNLVLPNNPGGIPSVDQIKEAICKFGCVVASVYVTNDWRHYNEKNTDGILFDHTDYREADNQYSTNHSIVIIGWDNDKRAWLVKNSWGADWGSTCDFGNERGYVWIDYASYNIGKRAAWVVAR